MGYVFASTSVVALVAVVSLSITLEPGRVWAAETGRGLSIALTPSNNTLLGRSGHVDLLVALQNTSSRPIPIKDGEIEGLYFIDVRDGKANQIALTEQGKALYASGEVFAQGRFRNVLLQPGQSVKRYVSVEHVYDMTQPGTYSIQLTRKFDDPSGPLYIRSNIVTVTVRQ